MMDKFYNRRERFKLHELKIDPKYLYEISEGRKTFEVRRNDRDFMEGDYLLLESFEKGKEEYKGSEWALVKVGFILKDFPALDEEFVCMSIAVVDQHVIPF